MSGLKTIIGRFYSKALRKSRQVIEATWYSGKSFRTRKNTLLLLRLDSIGDYVLFRNTIAELRRSEKYRHFRITLCGNFWWKELAERLDGEIVDEFIWINYSAMSDFNYRTAIYRQVRAAGFEVAIHPTYSRDPVSEELMAHCGAKQKIGYRGDLINLTKEQKLRYDLNYTQLISAGPEFQFEFYRNCHFFESLLGTKLHLRRPIIEVQPVKVGSVIVCPGAKHAFRRWSPAHFAELCVLLEKDLPLAGFAVCGSSDDSGSAREIALLSGISFTDHTGKMSIAQMIDVFAQASLIVTNDSGPFHIAVAMGKNTVCISNGNNYGRFTPYPPEMGTTAVSIFPETLTRIASEEERLRRYCREGSELDINSIKPQDVYQLVRKSFPALFAMNA